MDFKDILIFSKRDGKGKLVVPKSAILSIDTSTEKNWTKDGQPQEEITRLLIDINYAISVHLHAQHQVFHNQKGQWINIEEPLPVAIAMLQGAKAVGILFGDNK